MKDELRSNIKFWANQQLNLAQQHLNKADKTYPQHLKLALWFSYKCLSAGCLTAVHGLFPNFFYNSGTKTIDELYFTLHPEKLEFKEK